jgi:hypothetical protein
VCYADTNDTVAVLYGEPDRALPEPILAAPRARPPVLADRTDPSHRDAVVFLQNIYDDPRLAGVPRERSRLYAWWRITTAISVWPP